MQLAAPLICVMVLATASAASAEQAEPQFYARAPIASDARRHISVGVLGGYGWTLNPDSIDGLNAFAAGFGARGGVDIHGWYVGMRLLFYVGDSRLTPMGQLNFDETMLGLDAGYDIEFGHLTLRPQLGIGLAISSAELLSGTGVTMDRSSDALYLAPGFALTFDLSRRVFVGLDASVPIILRERHLDALTVMAATGLRF